MGCSVEGCVRVGKMVKGQCLHHYRVGWARGRKRKRGDPARIRELARARGRTAVSSAKRRARELGLDFGITAADITIPARCPLLDIPLQRGVGKHGPASPSVDRIDPGVGYVPGNVWVVSHRANSIKSNLTLAELELFVSRLRERVG